MIDLARIAHDANEAGTHAIIVERIGFLAPSVNDATRDESHRLAAAAVRAAAPLIERAVSVERDAILARAVVLMFERFMTLAVDRTRLGPEGVETVHAAYRLAKGGTDG